MAFERVGMDLGFYPADIDMSAEATWAYAPVWLAAPSNITSTADGAALVAQGSLTYPPLGILQAAIRQGHPGCVITTGLTKALAAGTIAIMDPVSFNSSGGLIKATTGKEIIGTAHSAGVSGKLFNLYLEKRGIAP